MNIRNPYFDYLRAMAIIMVVAIHCYDAQTESFLVQLIRNFLNCAVPLFLAVSAFFLSRKDLKSWRPYKNFLQVQIPKVYIPMVIWSLPIFL